MGLYPGSARSLPNSTPVDVALVDAQGDQIPGFDASRPAGAAHTQVTYAAGSQVLLAANAARRKYKVINATNKPVRLVYAATATLLAYFEEIAAGASYESSLNDYTGVISVIWTAAASAGSKLQVTEITTT